jgi:hypothetical protein
VNPKLPREYQQKGIPLKLIQSPSRPRDGTFLFARKAQGQVQVDFASFTRRTPSLRPPPVTDLILPRPVEMNEIIQQIQKKQNNFPLRFYSFYGAHQLGKSTIMLMIAHYMTRWYSRVVWVDLKDPTFDAANATVQSVERFVLAKAHLTSIDDLADESLPGVDKCIFFFDHLDKMGLNTQPVVHVMSRLLQNKSVRVVAIRKHFFRLPNFVDHGNELAPLKERQAVKLLLSGTHPSVWKSYLECKDPVFNGHCQVIACQADQGLPGLIFLRIQDLMRIPQTELAAREQLALWVEQYHGLRFSPPWASIDICEKACRSACSINNSWYIRNIILTAQEVEYFAAVLASQQVFIDLFSPNCMSLVYVVFLLKYISDFRKLVNRHFNKLRYR